MSKLQSFAKYFFVLILLLFPLFIFPQNSSKRIINNKIQRLELKGTWDFYPQKLITFEDIQKQAYKSYPFELPGYWNGKKYGNILMKDTSYGTFHLSIINNYKAQNLTLFVGQIMTAYKIYLNGELVASMGKVSKSTKGFKGDFKTVYKNIILKKGDNHFIFQVANFGHRSGGVYDIPVIGKSKDVFRYNIIYLALDLFLSGAFLFMAIYHFALFLLRRKEKSPLYFGIFSLLLSIRVLFTGAEFHTYLLPNLPWELAFKIEYLTFVLAAPIFGYFILTIFKETTHKIVIHIFGIIGLIFAGIILFTKVLFYSQILNIYQLIVLILIVYTTYIIIKNIKLQTQGVFILAGGAIIFFISVINDILLFNNSIKSVEIVPLGLFIFMFSQAFLLSLRFSKAFVRNEELTEELDYKNKNLEKIVQERTSEIQQQNEEIQSQAELLSVTNQELEKLSIVASETENAVTIFDKDLNINWVNQAFEKVYGFNLREFIQLKGKNLRQAASIKSVTQKINYLLETKQSINYENTIETKTGRKKWLQTTLTPVLDDNGQINKIVAIDSDITEQKETEQELMMRSEEIQQQNEQLQFQKSKIEFQNHHINASIQYARDIQRAILPIESNVNNHFNHFVLYQPKDVVSGDIYWFSELENYLFLAVIDCTGHGVPGAFMSMIANRLISYIINEKKTFSPKKILRELDKGVKKALKQDQTDNKDGMDVCLIRLEKKKKNTEAVFAGAKRPLILYDAEKKEIKTIKGDRFSIGGYKTRKNTLEFNNHVINLNTNDIIYLSSDGFIDQNNLSRKRFGSKRFEILLKEIAQLEMDEQKTILENVMEKFKNEAEQRDDITIWGIKL